MSFVVLFDISLPIVVHVTITDGRHHLVEKYKKHNRKG